MTVVCKDRLKIANLSDSYWIGKNGLKESFVKEYQRFGKLYMSRYEKDYINFGASKWARCEAQNGIVTSDVMQSFRRDDARKIFQKFCADVEGMNNTWITPFIALGTGFGPHGQVKDTTYYRAFDIGQDSLHISVWGYEWTCMESFPVWSAFSWNSNNTTRITSMCESMLLQVIDDVRSLLFHSR